MAALYQDDPAFRANFDRMHPRLAEFMGEAINQYVEALATALQVPEPVIIKRKEKARK